jgi:hypothetical protein
MPVPRHRIAIALLPQRRSLQGGFQAPACSSLTGAYVVTLVPGEAVQVQVYVARPGEPTRVFAGRLWVSGPIVALRWDASAALAHPDEPLASAVCWSIVRHYREVQTHLAGLTDTQGEPVCVSSNGASRFS